MDRMFGHWGGKGWGSGLIGVLIFSGSLPATRVAVTGFSPLFLTGARAAIAALLGAACLLLLRQQWPSRADIRPLAIVAIGVIDRALATAPMRNEGRRAEYVMPT